MRLYVDMHVHAGGADGGRPVKVTASRGMTAHTILDECGTSKGIDVVGIADCGSGRVLRDLAVLRERGELEELAGGGLAYRGRVVLLLGSEVECPGGRGGSAHVLGYFPTLAAMVEWNRYLGTVVSNPDLSTQRARVDLRELIGRIVSMGGEAVIAHAFTPHRSVYGACADRLSSLVDDLGLLAGVELGLSADTDLADRVGELAGLAFLTNSDAHSPGKIAREYNVMELEAADFRSVFRAMRTLGEHGGISANYGLDPRLGKYHRTFCDACGSVAEAPPPVLACPSCGRMRNDLVVGVFDRIAEIADWVEPLHPKHRPPYRHHIPLEFVPGLGRKGIHRLVEAFGSEMAVVHTAGEDAIASVVGGHLAALVMAARRGDIPVSPGGGGVYGRLARE